MILNPNRQSGTRLLSIGALLASFTLLSGCSGDKSDLEQWVAAKKAERVIFVDDIPQVKPYDVFVYGAGNLRSPFMAAQNATIIAESNNNVSPVENRNKEQLEDYSLDTLRMVGTMNRNSQTSALIQTVDGLIHQIYVGNYMGENEGRVVSINDSQIELIEIVPDGLGGYLERDAAIGLTD